MRADFENQDNLIEVMTENIQKDIRSYSDLVSLDASINREIYLGEIGDGIGSEIVTWIKFWNKQDDARNLPSDKRKPITIWIDSPGGNLSDAFTIVDAIKISKTPIKTIVCGICYSGAFLVSISADIRECFSYASFMWHEGSAQYGADANRMRGFQKFYEKQLNKLKEITIRNTKITEEIYKEHQVEDWYIDADEALELGIVDKISEEF